MPSEDKMRKTIKVAEAVARMPDGVRLMIGGFMGVGTPPRLIDEGTWSVSPVGGCVEVM
jgi:hypothetical protein